MFGLRGAPGQRRAEPAVFTGPQRRGFFFACRSRPFKDVDAPVNQVPAADAPRLHAFVFHTPARLNDDDFDGVHQLQDADDLARPLDFFGPQAVQGAERVNHGLRIPFGVHRDADAVLVVQHVQHLLLALEQVAVAGTVHARVQPRQVHLLFDAEDRVRVVTRDAAPHFVQVHLHRFTHAVVSNEAVEFLALVRHGVHAFNQADLGQVVGRGPFPAVFGVRLRRELFGQLDGPRAHNPPLRRGRREARMPVIS